MSEAQDEEAFAKEGKYQNFHSAVERSLKNFDLSSQWTDLVSYLSTLHKVLLAYTQYPVVPVKYELSRRLSQCLHHKLPHGVHLKTLDVYCAIFDRIKSDGLSADLHLYSSGLFPLMSFANIRVRSRLLEVYEKYILSLGYKLVPALSGFVLALLPGLEENSDHSDKILAIIDRIWNEIGRTELLDALWHSIILASSFRSAALSLVSTKLQQEQKYNKQVVEYDKPLSRTALEAALTDSNTYAQRMALDLLIMNYSFGKSATLIFSGEHVTTLLCPALCVLLRKDQSLTRRVYSWLLGDGNNNSEDLSDLSHQSYFDVHVKTHVISALRVLLTTKDFVSCLKIVHFLFDKSSICDSIREIIMLDMAWGLYKQSLVASGSKLEDAQNANKIKKKKISNKIGLLRPANLFFQTFGERFVWKWLEHFLKQSCDPSGRHSNGTVDEEMTVATALQVMLLLVKLLPLESYADHLPSLLTVLLNIIIKHYSKLMQECLLIESLTVIKSLVSLLHDQPLQKLSVSPSNSLVPDSNHDSSSSPDNTSSKELERAKNGVGGASCDCTTTVGVADVVKTYLLLFPKLIFDVCKVKHFDQLHEEEWEGSREAIECCQSSCDLLVDFLSLPLSAGDLDVASGNHVTLPEWLNGLFSCCVINHGIHDNDDVSHHHMMLQAISIFCHLLEMSNTVISQELRLYIFHQTKFCQQASRILYGCLVDVKLQSNGSRLLHRLHTSVKPLAVCEMVVVEGFSNHQDAVKPYQCYAVICQYTPQSKTESSQPRPFLRVGLRMLEGLQSSSPMVRNFVHRWVGHTSRKGNVEVLLSPIQALLSEIPVRKQHYKTISSQSLSTCYQLTEVVDTKRACFALNILTSLLEVGGAGLVQHFVGTTKQQQPQHNTLQEILSLLMAILLAEYSERMDLSKDELAAGLTVKCAVCNCLNELFINFIRVVRIAKEDSNNSGSRFFLSLLFLCEVQKLLLLMLCELQEGLQLVDSSSHESQPLLHSLLQAIGKILIIEFLSVPDDSSTNQKSSFSPKKLNSVLQKKTFIDANCLYLQPLFYALIMDGCKNGQFFFLDMTLKYLPYSNPTHLVPQLFNIISQLLKNSSMDASTVHLLFAVTLLTRFVWQEDSTFVTYANLQPLLNHLDVLHFTPSLADQNILRYKFPTRSCEPEVQSSNGGAISWLFSSIWSQRKSSDDNLMCDPLQEAVLEQLPRLYGTFASLWSRKDECLKLHWCSMNEPAIFEDIKLLMHELLLSPLTALPEAFMSTLAEMWMNWSSDATEDRRTNFITLLHTVKLVELYDLLDYIKKTLLLLRQMENSDAGAVRQKYLLHFLYKYLSSPHQSAEVLEQCYSVMLTFLRDCDQLLSHPESICLLTSILHVLVCRTTSPAEKKTRRELQETVYLLCVSLSGAAGVAASQGYVWLQRNTAISVPHLLPSSSANSTPSSPRSPTRSSSPNLFKDDETTPSFPTKNESSVEVPDISSLKATSKLPIHHQLQMPTIQALAVLSNVLSQFVDYVYVEKEKDKIVSLLSAVLYHVWPHLNDYSVEQQLCYEHSLSLLTSITEFTVARKSWKKETAELFLHPNYFNMPSSCIDSWLTIIDNLMSQDRSTLKQFLSQIRPISVPLMTKEQLTKLAGLIKRLAFVLFAGEVDQYEDLLPDMQDKLLEGHGSPVTSAQVLLCYHVMLLRFSPKQLQQIWPTITSQSAKICYSLFKDLQQLTGIQSATTHKEGLQYASYKPPSLLQCAVYINACHLVHTMLTISTEQLPQFQHVRWYYEGTRDDVDESVLNGTGGLCEKLNVESVTPRSLAVKLREIKSIVKRISNSLSTHRVTRSTSEDSHEIEETLKLLFLTS